MVLMEYTSSAALMVSGGGDCRPFLFSFSWLNAQGLEGRSVRLQSSLSSWLSVSERRGNSTWGSVVVCEACSIRMIYRSWARNECGQKGSSR